MQIAFITHTPEPQVWRYTLGMIVRRLHAMPALLPLVNPMGAGGADEEPEAMTDPNVIRAWAASMGIRRRPKA